MKIIPLHQNITFGLGRFTIFRKAHFLIDPSIYKRIEEYIIDKTCINCHNHIRNNILSRLR